MRACVRPFFSAFLTASPTYIEGRRLKVVGARPHVRAARHEMSRREHAHVVAQAVADEALAADIAEPRRWVPAGDAGAGMFRRRIRGCHDAGFEAVH